MSAESMEVPTDVVELCAMLQCLGFRVKSLDTEEINTSQDGGMKNVVIHCQTSGLHVVLESGAVSCSCPVAEQNSGFWQVSGITGGKQQDKETGSSILRSLPKSYREQLSKELQDMVRSIRSVNDLEVPQKLFNKSASMIDLANRSTSLVEREGNKSASMLELGSPEKRYLQIKAETPSRHRSLDALTSGRDTDPPARLLQNQYISHAEVANKLQISAITRRQSTYTICSTPDSVRRRNKTSSPIQGSQGSILDSLIEAERAAEGLRSKLAMVIKEIAEEKHDSSICSMLDVSKISVLKASETSKAQFASSPNLSALGTRDDLPSRLKRQESASTSNLSKATPENKMSKLRRISPGFLRMKKDSDTKDKDVKTKLQGIFKPRLVKPLRSGVFPEPSPNPSSASKKKYSHIKSTIPRPTPKKE